MPRFLPLPFEYIVIAVLLILVKAIVGTTVYSVPLNLTPCRFVVYVLIIDALFTIILQLFILLVLDVVP
jgi:hypothetical protein